MAKLFRVYETCEVTYRYSVEAENEDDAIAKVSNGDDKVEYEGEIDNELINCEAMEVQI